MILLYIYIYQQISPQNCVPIVDLTRNEEKESTGMRKGKRKKDEVFEQPNKMVFFTDFKILRGTKNDVYREQ